MYETFEEYFLAVMEAYDQAELVLNRKSGGSMFYVGKYADAYGNFAYGNAVIEGEIHGRVLMIAAPEDRGEMAVRLHRRLWRIPGSPRTCAADNP